MLDSLIRVSRRVEWNDVASIIVALTAVIDTLNARPAENAS